MPRDTLPLLALAGLLAGCGASRQELAGPAAGAADPSLLRLAAFQAGPLRGVAAAPRAAADLLGQPAEGLRAMLGEPSLRRAEGASAEIWLYLGQACALDLVLYRDRAGRLQVAFAAARTGEQAIGTAAEAECLRRIAAGEPPRPTI